MPHKQPPNLEGERSYKGAKDHNARAKRFLDQDGPHVDEEGRGPAKDINDALTDAAKSRRKKSEH